jgi:hypothetical protein
MATTFQSYSVPQRTIETKTGSDGDDATIQSTEGLVVLNSGGGNFSLNTPPTLAQIMQALRNVQSVQKVAVQNPAPTPNDGATLDFLNLDGSPDYTVTFPDGNQLVFSGTPGEMASVITYQGTYSLKSATNPATTFTQAVQVATPPTFGGANPAQPAQQTVQPA